MESKMTRLSAWMALFVVTGYVVCPTFCRAELGATATPTAQLGAGVLARPMLSDFATTTVVKGLVMKSLPNANNGIGAPTNCQVGDLLPDGSVVQTGKDAMSMAELKWGGKSAGKTTRIWRNSLVRVFCGPKSGRLDTICLAKGGLVFRKDKHEDNYYWVETKLLQARIHGTTVRVISEPASEGNPGVDKILVYEGGSVQVKNKETGSLVELTPGVELVVKVKASYKNNDTRFEIPEYKSAQPVEKSVASNDLPDYRFDAKKGQLLFEDRTSSVMAFTVNSKAVLQDSMVSGKNDLAPVDSFELIEDSMQRFPSSDNVWENAVTSVMNFGKPDRFLTNSKILKIVKVPETSAYSIGCNVGEPGEGKPIDLPATEHHPIARLDYDVSKSANIRPLTASAPHMVNIVPITSPGVDESLVEPVMQEPEHVALQHDSNEQKSN